MNGSKRLFYFNGFNSAIPPDWSDNDKIVAVEAFAGREGYGFLPSSVNYRNAAERAEELLAQAAGATRVVFAGSSMGGWFARIMQLLLVRQHPRLPVVALAFNPAFDLGQHGHLLLGPQVNHVTGEAYEWTEAHSADLAALETAVDYDAALPFFVYVDKGDEVIAWEHSARRHADIAHFRAYEGGSHLFEHAGEALQDFHCALQA